MTILEQINGFTERYGKSVVVKDTVWRYYRVGTGTPILQLGGGLRRTAIGYSFLEKLAMRHTVIAPDYPPVQTIDEFMDAFDAILQTVGVDTFTLGGQSYGGMLAQAFLALKGNSVERLVLSSTGPADAGNAWLSVLSIVLALAHILPEKKVKNLIAGELLNSSPFLKRNTPNGQK